MHSPASPERREVRFRGRVQGVGFRYTTRMLAHEFEVSGFVQNLADGSVQLVVEGEAAELDRLLASIDRELGHYVTQRHIDSHPASGEFLDFRVRH